MGFSYLWKNTAVHSWNRDKPETIGFHNLEITKALRDRGIVKRRSNTLHIAYLRSCACVRVKTRRVCSFCTRLDLQMVGRSLGVLPGLFGASSNGSPFFPVSSSYPAKTANTSRRGCVARSMV